MARLIKKLNYVYRYKGKNVRGEMEINLKRFEGQYSEAQYKLDSMVMTDMVPFMPMDTGQFINVTKAMSASLAGSGKVIAAGPPFGRFLYNGKVMIGKTSRPPWAKKGEKKIVTDRNLDFYKGRNPQAQSHWFDPAKKKNQKKWVKQVQKIAGGGE